MDPKGGWSDGHQESRSEKVARQDGSSEAASEQGDDLMMEAFGSPAEEPLLSLDEHEEGEKERRSSNRHVPEATQPAHGH